MTKATTLREIGVPVKATSFVALHAGGDAAGKPCIYAVMGTDSRVGHLFLLRIDPETGACRQFEAPDDIQNARPSLWSARWNRLFMYAAPKRRQPGRLLQFDPAVGVVEDLGEVYAEQEGLPVEIAEAPNGDLFLGSYKACALTRYSPATGAFRHYGSLDEHDQYLYTFCGDDGTVAGLVKMARPHVVVLDPETGERRSVGPMADTDTQTGHVNLYKGADSLLYIDSHEGYFRVNGMEAVPVESAPPPMPPAPLPDGTTFRFLDGHAARRHLNRTIELARPDGTRRVITLDYEAAGTPIYLVRTGPDNKIYGSSVLPLHLFSYDPDTGALIDHGACSTSSGEVYSMDNLHGKLYLCAYTHAVLCEYDPANPYSFGDAIDPNNPDAWNMGQFSAEWPCRFRFGDDDNPRQLGRMDTTAYRPRDMCCGPAGKVWVAALPDYGMWSGTLSWYDPRTDTFGGAHRQIWPECSPCALTYLPEQHLLAVGFTVFGGSGTDPRAEHTGFALWDPLNDTLVWRGDLGIPIVGVMDLEYAGDGLAYAIVHPCPMDILEARLLLLDLPNTRVVENVSLTDAAGWPLEVTFQRDDRFLYGATRQAVYRVPLGTADIQVLWQDADDGPTDGGALRGNEYYFATDHRLRAIRVNRDFRGVIT